MNLGKLPDGMDLIDARKKMGSFIKEIQQESKPTKCLVCGEEKTSFCNSHSVPRMVLKNIANNGKVLQANSLVGVEIIDLEKGVNNSGTFHFICNTCDSKLFQNYEEEEKLIGEPNNKLLSEIAIKDVLMMLYKRNFERALYSKLNGRGRLKGHETIEYVKSIDQRDYMDELNIYLGIKDSDESNFKLIYRTILPYKTPIATQTSFVLEYNLDGVQINDIFDMSEDVRIQNIHVSIFPLEESTVILLFYHRRDKNYRSLLHQFHCITEEEKLKWINYWIFKYTENYYFSPLINEEIKNNEKLVLLSQENYEMPNLGYITSPMDFGYTSINRDDIPNLLSKNYAL